MNLCIEWSARYDGHEAVKSFAFLQDMVGPGVQGLYHATTLLTAALPTGADGEGRLILRLQQRPHCAPKVDGDFGARFIDGVGTGLQCSRIYRCI